MDLRGVVQNGQIKIDVHGSLAEGTEVIVFPIGRNLVQSIDDFDLENAKRELYRVMDLPSQSPDDGFTAVNHDQILYGTR